MVGEGVLTGAGDGGSHCIQVRKQREEEEQMLAHLAFFFPFTQSGTPAHGMGHLYPGWALPPQFSFSGNTFTDPLKRVS